LQMTRFFYLQDVSSYMINWLSDAVNSIFIECAWEQHGPNLSAYSDEIIAVSSQFSQCLITMKKMLDEADSPIDMASKSFDTFVKMEWILGSFELQFTSDHPETKSSVSDDNIYLQRLRRLEQEINVSKQALHECWNDICQRESEISNLKSEIQSISPSNMIEDLQLQMIKPVDSDSSEEPESADLVDELRGYLECGICYSRFVDPVTLQCGHNVCRYCIRKMIILHEMQSLASVNCPWCKHDMIPNISELKTDRVLQDLVITLSSVT